MHQLSGSLQGIELSAILWLIPLMPLVAAAVAALQRVAPDKDRPEPLSGRFHVGAALGALGVLAFEVAQLWMLPAHRHFLLDTLGPALRVGSLDVGLSLSLDPLSAVVGVVVALCGVAAIVHGALPEEAQPQPGAALRQELLSLGLGSMLLLVLASNLAILAVGWGGASLAVYLAERDGEAAFGLARLADLVLLAGAALLFWTLGGAWSRSGEYTPDFQARVVGVETQPKPLTDKDEGSPDEQEQQKPPADALDGLVSMSSLPGATVSIGGAKLCEIGDDGKRGGLGVPSRPCRVVARAPFERLPVPGALHDFRIEPGPGTNPLLVEKVRVDAGKRVQLALAGSTLDFREMRDQLGIRDKSGAFPLRDTLLSKRALGLPALLLAMILLMLAALSKSLQWPLSAVRGSASLVAGGGGLVAGAYLAARLGFLLPLAPSAGGLLALSGALTALVAGLGILPSRDPRRIAAGFAVGQIGLALVGIGSGALAAGVLELAVAVPASLVLLLAAADLEAALGKAPDLSRLGGLGTALPHTARAWFIASLAATAAPYPALGAFWSRESILWGAFTGQNTGFVPGALLVVLGVLGAASLCLAAWRAYFLLFTGPAAKKKRRPVVKSSPSRIHTRLVLGLAWVSLLVGLLEASDRVVSGESPVWSAALDAWLSPLMRATDLSFNNLGTGMRLGLLLVGFGVPLFAWSAARRRYGPGRPEDWLEQEQRIFAFGWLERGDRLLPRLLLPLGRGVVAFGAVLSRLDDVLAFAAGAGPGGAGDEQHDNEADEREDEADEREDDGEADR